MSYAWPCSLTCPLCRARVDEVELERGLFNGARGLSLTAQLAVIVSLYRANLHIVEYYKAKGLCSEDDAAHELRLAQAREFELKRRAGCLSLDLAFIRACRERRPAGCSSNPAVRNSPRRDDTDASEWQAILVYSPRLRGEGGHMVPVHVVWTHLVCV